MKNRFNSFLQVKPKRAKFDLSHERKMTIPFGALVPTFVMEILPGDSVRIQANILARFQAGLAPFMHRVNVTTHYYFVPYRILNRNFTRHITYQGNRPNLSKESAESPFSTWQQLRTSSVQNNGAAGIGVKDGSLLDYLGFPTIPNDVNAVADANLDQVRINMLLPLAYQRIWNDHYRDVNTTHPLFGDEAGVNNVTKANTPNWLDDITNIGTGTTYDPTDPSGTTTYNALEQVLQLRWRCWERDYLTSASPYANQGVGDPRVPITVPSGALGTQSGAGNNPTNTSTFGRTGGLPLTPGSANNPSDSGSFTMTALRVAAALKRYLENSARGGTRYVEQLWTRWHVKSSDGLLNRSQYLGGGIQPMVISEVVTQAPATPTQTNIPAGSLAGHGISFGGGNSARSRFEEHGVMIGITSVMPRTAYLYSLPRAFMRSEVLDYATPEFANLGEQGILGAEVFFKPTVSGNSSWAPNYTAGGSTAPYTGLVNRWPSGFIAPASYLGFDLQNQTPEVGSGSSIWGYQERYAEYKYIPDTVHGLFRNTQSFWHFGRMLSPGAQLNAAFMTSNPRMDGFAVLPNNGGAGQYNQHPINLQVYNKVSAVRSLPYYAVPKVI